MDVEGIDAFADELGDWIVARPPKPYDGKVEFELFCPVHEDPETSHKPSAQWNPVAKAGSWSLGVMHCFKPGCELKRNAKAVRTEWRKKNGTENAAEVIPFPGLRSVEDVKPVKGQAKVNPDIDPETYETMCELLYESPERLNKMLADKGIIEQTLRDFNWAWESGKDCYIYPVHRISTGEPEGHRLYDPFHLQPKGEQKARDKKRWYRTESRHTNQLWGWKQADLDEGSLILSEGETDLMLMHQDGYRNVITQTGGAGTWVKEWGETFRDKVAYICYDPDDAGRAGRAKVSLALKSFARAVYFIELPDGMDYCEWRLAGHTPAEFQALIVAAKEDWRRETDDGLPSNGVPISSIAQLKDVTSERYVEMRAYVAGKVERPWQVGKLVGITCAKNKGKKCEVCPRAGREAGQEDDVEFSPHDDDQLVAMMNARTSEVKKLMAESLDLRCDDIEINPKTFWHVEQVSIQDPVDTNNTLNDARYSAFHFYDDSSAKLAGSTDYRMIARRLADPRDQQLVVLAWNAQQTTTNLDSFRLTPDIHEQLKKFRPTAKGRVGVRLALRRKYKDLSVNVTKIAGRDNMHLMHDLVTHSVLRFRFDGTLISKGLLDAMIMGDTRAGKTEMVVNLNAHYGVGLLISGENTSYAGLIGGSVEMSGSSARMAEWGPIPRHHKRMVQIDETSGLQEIITRMSSVRTSGIAEVNKIGGGRVPASVRLLWLSNPAPHDRSNRTRPIGEYKYGASDAIVDLIKGQEDIARFDIAMAVASEEVTDEQIRELRSMVVPHVYTAELCHMLATYAWTRTADNIFFAEGVTDLIYDVSKQLAGKYVSQPPFVQASNFSAKLARMCVALATMLYSTDETGEDVIVRPEHVNYMADYVQECYDNDYFGYGRLSRRKLHFLKLGEDSTPYIERYLAGEEKSTLAGLPDGPEMCEKLRELEGHSFSPSKLAQMCRMLPGDGEMIISFFASHGMMERAGEYARFTLALSKILREYDDDV
jgi:hypothetical protein